MTAPSERLAALAEVHWERKERLQAMAHGRKMLRWRTTKLYVALRALDDANLLSQDGRYTMRQMIRDHEIEIAKQDGITNLDGSPYAPIDHYDAVEQWAMGKVSFDRPNPHD